MLWAGKICPEVPLTSKAVIWPITGGTGLVAKVPTAKYAVSEGKYCAGLGERKEGNNNVWRMEGHWQQHSGALEKYECFCLVPHQCIFFMC